jgi:hypothetical protein
MTAAGPPASPAPPQVLLAHHLRQLKLPTSCANMKRLPWRPRAKVSIMSASSCVSPNSNSSIARGAWPSGASAPRVFRCRLDDSGPLDATNNRPASRGSIEMAYRAPVRRIGVLSVKGCDPHRSGRKAGCSFFSIRPGGMSPAARTSDM